jgi:hypothetical protein
LCRVFDAAQKWPGKIAKGIVSLEFDALGGLWTQKE